MLVNLLVRCVFPTQDNKNEDKSIIRRQTSKMGKFTKSKSKKPFTPVRSFFDFLHCKLKPSKSKAHDKLTLGPRTASPSPCPTHAHAHTSPPKRPIALQNSDPSSALDDTVILTSLPAPPFCCHEDLLAMPRAQLRAVAHALNARLPRALRIDVRPGASDALVRSAIELIVGIERAPGAPKAARTTGHEYQYEDGGSPPTSPLAMKAQMQRGRPRLAALQEEDDEDPTTQRPSDFKRRVSASAPKQNTNTSTKKRRMSAQPDFPPTRPAAAASAPDTGADGAAPLARAKSQRTRVPARNTSPPRPTRVLRSHSAKLPAEMRILQEAVDTSFITVRRPRYRYRPKSRSRSTGEMGARGRETSTPPRSGSGISNFAESGGADADMRGGRHGAGTDETFGMHGMSLGGGGSGSGSGLEMDISF